MPLTNIATTSTLPSKITFTPVSINQFPFLGVASESIALISKYGKFVKPTDDLSLAKPYGNNSFGGDKSKLPKGPFGPVVSWFTIKAGNYFSLNDNTNIEIKADLTIFDCLINTKTDKNIVETKVPGRAGTVKTYISSSDVDLQIEGIIYNSTMSQGIYPADIVKNLYKCASYPISLTIESPFLNNILNIKNIVIKSIEISQLPGQYSQQKFSMRAVSDIQEDINLTPYSSIINNNKFNGK